MSSPLDVPEWDPRLSVGYHYIDAQHAMLFHLIGQLRRALVSDEARKHLVAILDEVKKYATFHFASEENYMADIDYPERHRHAQLHTRMLVELADHVRRVEADPQHGELALRFVEDWLYHHVAHEDQKFAKYAKADAGAT
jgi:hemerythrin-like metal-binding protein